MKLHVTMSPEISEEIEELEKEIRDTPYNKATQFHIGKLKAKLSKLREKHERQGKGTSSGGGYGVKKEGDATIGLVGYPSVGKSTLLNELTNAKSEVAEYHFTTLDVIPGVMTYEGAEIQILDLPGLVKGAAAGKGRGREVLSVIRVVDLIILMGDVYRPDIDTMEEELEAMGIRLNKTPPEIVIRKRDRGGIDVASTVELNHLEEDTIKEVMRIYGHINASIIIRDDITVDELIDHLLGNRVYIPSFSVINKAETMDGEKLDELKSELSRWDPTYISVKEDRGIEELKKRVFDKLDFMRVYLRPQGEKGDDEPLIVKRGSTVEDICMKLHTDFKEKFRYARIWGPSSRFPQQQVGLDHILHEGDTVRIITR